MLCLSLLPLVAAERIGENRMDYFDISRTLDSSFLKGSFLAVGEDEIYLATYYVAAAVAVILFVVLLVSAARCGMNGGLTIRFLLLFGAASIITESLRYDFFLSISFVGLQQVAAALMLALGVILAIRHNNRPKSVLIRNTGFISRNHGIATVSGITAMKGGAPVSEQNGNYRPRTAGERSRQAGNQDGVRDWQRNTWYGPAPLNNNPFDEPEDAPEVNG